MAKKVLMPKQGQSVESCIIVEWKVNEGDFTKEGDPLCEVETDKAAFEVEAPADGTVLRIFYPADAEVEVLKTIAVIGRPDEDISAFLPTDQASKMPAVTAKTEADFTAVSAQAPKIETDRTGGVNRASPRARRLAAEKGVDLSLTAGTGPGGRVIERDITAENRTPVSPVAQKKAAVEGWPIPVSGTGLGGRVLASDLAPAAPPEVEKTAASRFNFPGKTTEIPLQGIRKVIADRMLTSLQHTAQLTIHTSVDARSMLEYRRKCKAAPENTAVGGISLNDVVLYAAAKTLGAFPELNVHRLDGKLVRFEHIHLGFAVDTPRGLIVPIIPHANLISLRQLSAETKRLAKACIEGSIEPKALSGGTFTVTNLGALGIESFTPVLNVPEIAVLGVCSIQPRPVVNDEGEVDFVPYMGLSLTFDHCAIDGAPAARFLSGLRARMASFELTLAG